MCRQKTRARGRLSYPEDSRRAQVIHIDRAVRSDGHAAARARAICGDFPLDLTGCRVHDEQFLRVVGRVGPKHVDRRSE